MSKEDLHDDDIRDEEPDNDDVDDLDEGGFEHKYNTLQGKYNSEIGRMNDMLSRVLQENADLRGQLTDGGGKKPETFTDTTDNFDNDIQAFQADYPNLFKGIVATVRREVTNTIKPIEQKVEETNKSIGTMSTNTVFSTLDSTIPRWREVNRDQDFIQWLQVPDRYSGTTKQQLLLASVANGDAGRASMFFKDYAAEKKIDLVGDMLREETFAPNSSGNPNPSGRRGGAEITREDIAKFYRERANGSYAGTDEDAAKFEAKIMRAAREGKVR